MENILKIGKASATGSFQLFIGRILSFIIMAVGTIILTRLMLPAEYGLYAIALTPSLMISLFRDWGVSPAITKYIAQHRTVNKEEDIYDAIAAGPTFAIATGIACMHAQTMKNASNSPTKFRLPSKRTTLLITITVITTLVVSSIISIWLSNVGNLNIPSTGRITTLGVEGYWDKDLENKTETFDWGTIWPGTSKNLTLHLRSISNIETTLILETTNWTFNNSENNIVAGPSNSTPFMNLTWNYNGTTVRPAETIQVTLTLSVDYSSDFIEFVIANDVREFGVDIIVCTSEYAD